jgi:hypothetical protein
MSKNLMELMRNFEMVPRLKKSIKVTFLFSFDLNKSLLVEI